MGKSPTQCHYCGTHIEQGVTQCPSCGAAYQKGKSVFLAALAFNGWCFLAIGALPYLNSILDISRFASIPSPLPFAVLGVACLALYAFLRWRVRYRWRGGARIDGKD